MQLPDAPLLRRCFHSLVAMAQAATNCDFYITKYLGKSMEQLQSLISNIALGLRRLEEEEIAASAVDAVAVQPTDRARRATLKIAAAANRSSWCSCCELASFIQTGALVRRTHRPVSIFLSRTLYMYEECRRLVQRGHLTLIEVPDMSEEQTRPVDALCFESQPAASSLEAPSHDTAHDDANSCDSDQPQDPLQGDSDHNSEPGPEAPLADNAEQPAPEEESSAAQPAPDTRQGGDNQEPTEETDEETPLLVTGLEFTTSAHDDWLHRGPFLYDLDFHTYIRCVCRKARAKQAMLSDVQRQE